MNRYHHHGADSHGIAGARIGERKTTKSDPRNVGDLRVLAIGHHRPPTPHQYTEHLAHHRACPSACPPAKPPAY